MFLRSYFFFIPLLSVCFFFFPRHSLAWEMEPQVADTTIHWWSETGNTMDAKFFAYKNNGKSVLRYSLTPPFEGSTAGRQAQFNKWNPMDGKLVVRFRNSGKTSDGFEQVWLEVGGDTRNDKNKLYTGIIYLWYGEQRMITYSYTMWYDPFVIVSSPSGVIDLGTCHKVNKGDILSKDIMMNLNIYGYTNGGPISATRTMNFGALPKGAFFTQKTGSIIKSGKVESVGAVTTPNSLSDTFSAKLNCDEANVGLQTWNVGVTYTVQ